ncbi:MAG: family metallo-hydrolase [Sphingomonadales bacterium]|nr:family metallo-hydrolase [Sphingomonadales bacterium]
MGKSGRSSNIIGVTIRAGATGLALAFTLLPVAAAATPRVPAGAAVAEPLRPDQQAFRAIYRELVETNTTVTTGSCTVAAMKMANQLRRAGLPETQIIPFAAPDHPADGGLVVIYPGTSAVEKPILLLAHLDVVEAKPQDWARDPFKLIEENGNFYARGALDDKAQAAIWTDMLARFARTHYQPRRTIKLALTCGEETAGAFNGAQYLARQRRDLIDAAFALNEGGFGHTDGKSLSSGGRLIDQTILVGEKAYQDFALTVTSPGGHSSQPVPDNAIYEMADALRKVRDLEFPIEFNATTRSYFQQVGKYRNDAVGAAMVALAANSDDKASERLVNTDRMLHSTLRTTCVATLVEGGHALNALPQRVQANLNCRIFPGHSSEETRKLLIAAIDNPVVSIELRPPSRPIAKSPPLDPKIIGPMRALAVKYFPGVPVIPYMGTGATDGIFLAAAGIPTYGVPGLWVDPDFNGIHGLNERLEVASLYKARDYLTDLVKTYTR